MSAPVRKSGTSNGRIGASSARWTSLRLSQPLTQRLVQTSAHPGGAITLTLSASMFLVAAVTASIPPDAVHQRNLALLCVRNSVSHDAQAGISPAPSFLGG